MHHLDLVHSQLAADGLLGDHVIRSFRGTSRHYSYEEVAPHA